MSFRTRRGSEWKFESTQNMWAIFKAQEQYTWMAVGIQFCGGNYPKTIGLEGKK